MNLGLWLIASDRSERAMQGAIEVYTNVRLVRFEANFAVARLGYALLSEMPSA